MRIGQLYTYMNYLCPDGDNYDGVFMCTYTYVHIHINVYKQLTFKSPVTDT